MKYIVLSAGQEWNDYCWENAQKNQNIRFIKSLFKSYWLKFGIKLWNLRLMRINSLIRLMWFPFFKSQIKITNEETCLIIYDWNTITLSRYVIQLFREHFPNLKIVYIFTNFTKVSGARTFGLLDNLKQDFDIVFAFDPIDSKKYGFEYSRLIYEPDTLKNTKPAVSYDLFYVGQAKDRYPKLIEIFKKAIQQGLKCKFFITGVSSEDRYEHPDIIYNKQLPYSKVLDYIKKSRCLVDAIQGESSGMTIKTSESVVWNKKLITTNDNVVNEPYFNPSNIMVYLPSSDLAQFIKAPFIPYSDKDKFHFSSNRLFDQIEMLVNKQDD